MLKFARTPSRPRSVLSMRLGALAAALCLTPWAVLAQSGSKKGAPEPPPQLRSVYDAVNLDISKAMLDRALQEIFKLSRYNYLYADNEVGDEISAHFSNLPLNNTLDTLSRGASFQWDVRNNIVYVQQDRGPVDPADRRLYSAHVRLTPLTDVLQVLKIIHPLRFRVEGDVPQVVEAKFARIEFADALAEILAQCETPMKSKQIGDTLILSPDPARPRRKKAGVEPAAIVGQTRAAVSIDPNAPRRYNMLTHTTFDQLISSGFRMLGKPVRIAPTVTDSDEIIDFNREGTFDEMLSALLATHPGQKTPLTYRLVDGVYVIEPRGAPARDAEIVFPKLPGENASRADYTIENRPVGEALQTILDQTGENYWLCIPNGDKAVTMRLKNATVAQALRTALRSAATRERLIVVRDKGLYCVAPERLTLTAAGQKDWKFTGRFNGISAWDAFQLAFTPLGNYTVEDKVKAALVTATFKDRTFDQALSDMARGASPGVIVEYHDNTLFVRAQ